MTRKRDPSIAIRRPRPPGAWTDLFWWCLAAALGFFAASSPQLLLPPAAEPMTRAVFLNGAFLVVGILMGAFKPEGAWRWGLASILALPLADLIKLGGDPNFGSLTTDQLVSVFVHSMPTHITRLVPAGAGAYLGAYMWARRV